MNNYELKRHFLKNSIKKLPLQNYANHVLMMIKQKTNILDLNYLFMIFRMIY